MQEKTIIERGGLGAPHPTPTVEDLSRFTHLQSNNFSLNQANNATLNRSNTSSSPF